MAGAKKCKKETSKEEPRKLRDYKGNTQGESAHTMSGQHDKELRKTENLNKQGSNAEWRHLGNTDEQNLTNETRERKTEYEAPKTQDYQNKTGTKLCTE